MTNVLVLGSGGMLGSMVASVLAEDDDLEVTTTARSPQPPAHAFDAERDSVAELLAGREIEWVVNAIGVIKPRIDESDPASILRATAVNAEFPYRLAEALEPGQRVIQIATDCVYSGATGGYDEDAPHDPHDVYGKTKSLGEVPADEFVHLRCSIIGPERGEPRSLLGWMLSQPRDGEVSGYTNHSWNGVTTLQFAKLCEAVIQGRAGASQPPARDPRRHSDEGGAARDRPRGVRPLRRDREPRAGAGGDRPHPDDGTPRRQPAPVGGGRLHRATGRRRDGRRARRSRPRAGRRLRFPCPA
jgi:dTDP-4-dehydrorhamnose reductase